jgi:predicted metal-dependent peptidase
MDSSDCQVAITFIERALQIFPDCKVRMRQADTRTIVGADRTFSRFDFPMQIPLEWQGRGGTDLSPSIAEIAKEGNYEWLIIVTDMEWSVSQAVDPKIPTLWLTTEEIHGARRTPTFGQVVGPVQKEMIRR